MSEVIEIKENQNLIQKTRISWIDTAKGFLMLCVIAGHTLPLGSIPQRLIYSFHIPLFVILSGYTMGEPKSFYDFFERVKKSFIQLYIPMFVIYAIEAVGFKVKNNLELEETLILFIRTVVYAIHVPWFLCVLFYARLIYSLILLLKIENPVLFILIFISGFFIQKIPGFHGFYQQMEKLPFFMFFLFLGRYSKKYNLELLLGKHGTLFLFLLAPIWFILLPGAYFDLGLFYLGNPHFTILCSGIACLLMLYFCMTIDNYKFFRVPLSFLGKHTILLLAIHDLEFMLFPWRSNFTNRIDEYGTLALRLMCNLAVFVIIMAVRFVITKMRKNNVL